MVPSTPVSARQVPGGYSSMNCSLPTMPILVSPSRCDDAITAATISYRACLSGRRCSSGCDRLRGGRGEPVPRALPAIRQRLAVPVNGARRIDVDLDDFGRDHQRRRRIAGRHVQIHRVQLDRDRDDQHDEQHQHHVDQRRRVDVDHDVGLSPDVLPTFIPIALALFDWPGAASAAAKRRLGDEADLGDARALARHR